MSGGVGWQLGIVHSTGYRYDSEVGASYNEARLSPQSTPRQVTLDVRIDVSPRVRLFPYYDYWGTLVHAFDVHVPHTELVVRATSAVVTNPPPDPPPELRWRDLEAAADPWLEHLLPSRFVPDDPELTEIGRELRAKHIYPFDASMAAVATVQRALKYEPGSTSVSTTGPEAWRRQRGVCQDFAHVLLGLVRAMGLPARYVSGYVHPAPDARVGELVEGQSHAWVEVWAGAWVPVDATARDPAVGERHVIVARGRDYGDVPPLKGIFSGAAAPDPVVTVQLERTA